MGEPREGYGDIIQLPNHFISLKNCGSIIIYNVQLSKYGNTVSPPKIVQSIGMNNILFIRPTNLLPTNLAGQLV